jgi:hypothetical protein
MKVDGRCHCGAIRYEAEVEAGTINICHCIDCQTLTGSTFRANIQTLPGTFRIISGEPKLYTKTAASGAKRVHAFCGTCGGPVYASAAVDPQTYSLRTGALSQRYELGVPRRQIWMQRRMPWISEIDRVPAVEGQPKP